MNIGNFIDGFIVNNYDLLDSDSLLILVISFLSNKITIKFY